MLGTNTETLHLMKFNALDKSIWNGNITDKKYSNFGLHLAL